MNDEALEEARWFTHGDFSLPGVSMKKSWCPRCDQGWVVPIKVPALGLDGLFCEECDAFWPLIQQPTEGSFIDFGTFMKAHGLQGAPSEVEFPPPDPE